MQHQDPTDVRTFELSTPIAPKLTSIWEGRRRWALPLPACFKPSQAQTFLIAQDPRHPSNAQKQREKQQKTEEKKYKIIPKIDLHSFQIPTENWSYVRLVKYDMTGYQTFATENHRDLGGDRTDYIEPLAIQLLEQLYHACYCLFLWDQNITWCFFSFGWHFYKTSPPITVSDFFSMVNPFLGWEIHLKTPGMLCIL